MTYAHLLALLIFAHAVADYPLQGEFLAKAKSRTMPIPGFPWWQALTAHAVIHGGFVFVITGSLGLGAAELVMHWITDDLKCRGKLGINTDQAIHVICKIIWAAIAVFTV